MKNLWLLFFSFKLFAQFEQLPEGRVYYKIAIEKTGVYSFSLKDLKNSDLKGLNKDNIQLFAGHSGALPDTLIINPGLQEIPLYWANASSFWFFANGPESLNQRANTNASQNYVFLFLNGSKHKTVGKASKASQSEASNLVEVSTMHELEIRNNVYSGREWLGEYFSFSPVQKISFNLENLDPTSRVSMVSQTVSGSPEVSSFEVSVGNEKIITHRFDPVGTGRYDIKGRVDIKNAVFKSNTNNIELTYSYKTAEAAKNQSLGFLDFIKLISLRKISYFSSQTIAQPKTNILDFSASKNIVWGVSDQKVDMLSSEIIDVSSYEKLVFFNEKNVIKAKVERNQNIKLPSNALYLIVATVESYQAALRLAMYRAEHNGIDAKVVLASQIYDAYSSGKADPVAIRNYILGLKDVKYLLLFGDATYDPKNNVGFESGTSLANIPTFQSLESLDPVRSYCSDDFFGIKSATWPEAYHGNREMTVAVGRLPTKNRSEAAQMVEKIINHETSKQRFGIWRLRHQYIADDGDANEHLKNSEKLTTADVSGALIEKAYIDAYFQDTSKTKTLPALNQYLINDGMHAGFVNYTGHGGREALAQERILTFADVQAMSNTDRLPIFFTATCEFGRFDDPAAISSAELALLNPRGGSIALCTTTRPVYSSTNFEINKTWVGLMATQKYKYLGDLFMATKNQSQRDVYNRNFTLLGDPMLALSLPENSVKIDQGLYGNIGTIENGKAEVLIYQPKKEQISFGFRNPKIGFLANAELAYHGPVEVKNGKFSIKSPFSIKDASVLVYAVNSDSTVDSFGRFEGNIIAEPSFDKTPPTIDINYIDGVSVVTISDNAPIGFSNLIEIKSENGTLFPLKIRPISENTFSFLVPSNKFSITAVDFNNNRTTQTFDFSTKNANIFVKAYPNPFVDFINFDVTLPKTEGKAVLSIYDSNGHILFKNEKQTSLTLGEIKWQWFADTLPADGLLFYSLIFTDGNGQLSKGGRLIFWK